MSSEKQESERSEAVIKLTFTDLTALAHCYPVLPSATAPLSSQHITTLQLVSNTAANCSTDNMDNGYIQQIVDNSLDIWCNF